MKKTLLFITVLTLISVISFEAQAQTLITGDFDEYEKRSSVGANLSAFVPGKDEFDPGVYAGGVFSYDFYRWFALGIEGGYFQSDINNDGLDVGKLRGGPILGEVILKAPMDMYDFVFTPYAVFGLGVLLTDIEESSAVGGKIETTAALLLKGGGGIELIFNETIAVFIEGSYQFASVEFEDKGVKRSSGLDGSSDLDIGYFGGGLKLRF